jgi:anti-anti-sigma regulatory factor
MNNLVLHVPDAIGHSSENLEELFHLTTEIKPGVAVCLDMSQVTWIVPSGVLSLVIFVRYANKLTNHKVCLLSCQTDVTAYLKRVDFFETCREWAYTTDSVLPGEELSRSEASTSLLELSAIRDGEDVRRIADRTSGILSQWLTLGSSQQSDLISILSEMCENICEHSQDIGHVAIQRYRRHRIGLTEVRIAVCDMGLGIRNSLIPVHGEFGSSSVEYILAALAGRSARGKNRTGNGFQNVQQIIQRCRGTLYVRSEDSAVRIRNTDNQPQLHNKLNLIPGTQVSIRLIQ